jgi:hypothetical protein
MAPKDAPNLTIATDRKPRERKSLAERIAELKAAKQAHLGRAEAVEGKLLKLLGEQEQKARAVLDAVREAGAAE